MREFVIHSRSGRPPWLALFVPGAALMAFGVLILVLPELVKLLFAALFMALGFVLMGFAWRLKSGGMPGGMGSMMGRMFDQQP